MFWTRSLNVGTFNLTSNIDMQYQHCYCSGKDISGCRNSYRICSASTENVKSDAIRQIYLQICSGTFTSERRSIKVSAHQDLKPSHKISMACCPSRGLFLCGTVDGAGYCDHTRSALAFGSQFNQIQFSENVIRATPPVYQWALLPTQFAK